MRVQLFKPKVSEEAIAAAAQVMRSGWLGMGPVTAEFEKDFARFLSVQHVVAVNTCTSALHLAIKLLRLAKGAEVISSAVTFVAANEVLLYEGLTPVFADVDPATGNLTPQSVAARLSERTGAIMLTHFGGYACDLAGFRELAAQRDLPIVEDCAHACGAWYQGKRIGASGNLCAFSFDPIKNLTTGDGGMLITSSEAQQTRARNLRYMGLTRDAYARNQSRSYSWEYGVPELGYRYHMNDIAAAIGREHLKHIDADNATRAQIAEKYRGLLKGVPGLTLLQYAADRQSSYHLFSVLAESRNALADKMAQRGVIVGAHFPRNDVYPVFQQADLPNAESFCSRVMSLPMHTDLRNEEIEYVAGVIREGW